MEETAKSNRKEVQARYRQKHKAKLREYLQAWRKANPDKWKKQAQRHNYNVARNNPVPTYRWHARKRGRTWELDNEFCLTLMNEPCHYCGFVAKFLNGIDRKDNARGYEIDNVLPCCGTCNYAKRCMSYENFQQYLERVASFVTAKKKKEQTTCDSE